MTPIFEFRPPSGSSVIYMRNV